MRNTYSTVALLLLVSQLSYPVHAEPKRKRLDSQKIEEIKEKHMDKLTRELNLTSDQQSKVKAAFDEQKPKIEALHKEMAEKRKALMEETDGKIEAVLTPEQKTKYEKIKAERREKIKEWRGQEDKDER